MSSGTDKYRAWHKIEQKMIYFSLGELLGYYCDEFNYCSVADTDLFRWHDDFENLDIMRYTGLNDKRGKEIYDGDVFEGKGVQWTCKWSKSHARWIVSTPNKYNLHGVMLKSLPWAISRLELVGNIYQPTLQGVIK